jgi:hypothetical protein
MNIYNKITPTRLMIKKHSITGLLYFCKSIRKDVENYLGSGGEWRKHLKENGRNVKNLWVSDWYYDESIKEDAINFSIMHDIVNSDIWANKCLENGKTGGTPGFKHSKETKNKMRLSAIGKKMSAESIVKMRNRKNQIKLVNIYCMKTEEIIEENITMSEFCRKNPRYHKFALSQVAQGKRRHHKGIVVKFVNI